MVSFHAHKGRFHTAEWRSWIKTGDKWNWLGQEWPDRSTPLRSTRCPASINQQVVWGLHDQLLHSLLSAVGPASLSGMDWLNWIKTRMNWTVWKVFSWSDKLGILCVLCIHSFASATLYPAPYHKDIYVLLHYIHISQLGHLLWVQFWLKDLF